MKTRFIQNMFEVCVQCYPVFSCSLFILSVWGFGGNWGLLGILRFRIFYPDLIFIYWPLCLIEKPWVKYVPVFVILWKFKIIILSRRRKSVRIIVL